MPIAFDYAVDPMKARPDSSLTRRARRRTESSRGTSILSSCTTTPAEESDRSASLCGTHQRAKMVANYLTKIKSMAGIDEDTARVGMMDMCEGVAFYF